MFTDRAIDGNNIVMQDLSNGNNLQILVSLSTIKPCGEARQLL